MNSISDFIYYDTEKISSIISQYNWGLIEEQSIAQTSRHNIEGNIGIKPPLLEAGLDLQKDDTFQILQKKKLYHDLFNRVIKLLKHSNIVTSLSPLDGMTLGDNPIESIFDSLLRKPFLEVEGRVIIENYASLPESLAKLKKVIKSMPSLIEASIPELKAIRSEIEKRKSEIKTITDRNKKSKENIILQAKTAEYHQLLESSSSVPSVDNDLLDAISPLVEILAGGRINLRLFPYPNYPEFQVICNLKKENFVDDDLEHLLYGYGIRPNIKMKMLGLATSLPDPESDIKAKEIINRSIEENPITSSLLQVLDAINEFELFGNSRQYPKVIVHPFAIYREFNYEINKGEYGNSGNG